MTREEALDRMKRLDLNSVDREALYTIIPELRGSDDERIRSCIGLALTDVNEQRFKDFGITLKDCLSWLEKQKEQKTISQEDFDAAKHEALWGEQNARDYCSVRDEFDLDGNLKQKPAEKQDWSEEDDATIKSAVHWLEKYLSTIGAKDVSSATQDGILTVKVTITNLKSLRPRPSWKPSKEEMKAFRRCIEDLQARAEAAVGGWDNFNVMIRLYEELKKL